MINAGIPALEAMTNEYEDWIEQLVDSPPFYIKTVISVLLTGIKTEQGAAQEHAMGNLSAIIQPAWIHLPEQDRWQIGNAYRDAISSGNIAATKGLKNALMKVKGFDYVLRWSDIRTWGTDLPPVDGDLVHVPKGMCLYVDQSTPNLLGIAV